MVKQIEEIDDYYHSDDEDDDEYLFYAPTHLEIDEQIVVVACLMLLESRYRVLRSMTPQRVAEEVENMIDSLNVELTSTAIDKIDSTVQTFFKELLEEYSIPDTNYVSIDTSMYPIVEESINTLCNQLKGELKQKALFFKDNMSNSDFNILPNIKRAVQRIIDAVGTNLVYSKEKTHRNVDKFVYGEDKLYYWITANDDRVCNWCRVQESLPPRTIDEIPLDHPWGRCVLEPVDYMYSNEYMLLLARGEYYDGIEAFRE